MGIFRSHLNNGLNGVSPDEGEMSINTVYFSAGYGFDITDFYRIVPLVGVNFLRYRYFTVDKSVISSGVTVPLSQVNPNIIQLYGSTQDALIGLNQSFKLPERGYSAYFPNECVLKLAYFQNVGNARNELVGVADDYPSDKSLYSHAFQISFGISWRI